MARRMPILIEFPVGNEIINVGSVRDTYGYCSPSLFSINTTGFRVCFCCYWQQVTILACSVCVIWRLISPSSCLSFPVITTEPFCQLNLSCYECAIIAGHPLHQTHNSLPTTPPTWLLRFVGDIRARCFDCDKLTKCSISRMGFSFRKLCTLRMMLKLVIQGNSHPYVQLKRYFDAIWKRAIFTLWPVYIPGAG
jgi:hypothetical protein